jgi:hypothetical protein
MFGWWRVATGLLFCYAAVIAQVNNSVTVNASQAAGQPDLVVFSVTVTSEFDATLEDVVNSVSGLGITAANLTGLGVPNPAYTLFATLPRQGPPQEQWTFQLVVPFAQMKSTTAALVALQKSISSTGLSLGWTVTGTQTSTAASTCNLSNLAALASAQAQQIATAASVKLGAISSLSISTSGCSLTASYALSTAQPGARTLAATALETIAGSAPDQVQLEIQVSSPLTATLSSITAALTKASISGITFAGVTQNLRTSFAGPVITWTFTETVPLSKLAPTLAQLSSESRSLGAGLRVAFGPNGVSYSQPPACPEAGLFSQAQTLAQNVAAAAGASAGPLLSMSSGGVGSPVLEPVQYIDPLTSVPYAAAPTAACSLTAQFQLL